MALKRFYLILSLLLLAAVGVHAILALVLPSYPLFGRLWLFNVISLAFVASKSGVGYWFVRRNLALTAWRFVNVVSAAMMLKLFLSIGWVVVMVFVAEVPAFGFTLPYFGAYILFSAFEIMGLLNNLRPDSQKPSA